MFKINNAKLKGNRNWFQKFIFRLQSIKAVFSKRVIEVVAEDEEDVNEFEIDSSREKSRSIGILDYIEDYDMKKKLKNEDVNLSENLMEGITRFREETGSLDYIRNEIESVMNTDGGEEKMMTGFVNTLKSTQKKLEG